jgi:hypothetical protein
VIFYFYCFQLKFKYYNIFQDNSPTDDKSDYYSQVNRIGAFKNFNNSTGAAAYSFMNNNQANIWYNSNNKTTNNDSNDEYSGASVDKSSHLLLNNGYLNGNDSDGLPFENINSMKQLSVKLTKMAAESDNYDFDYDYEEKEEKTLLRWPQLNEPIINNFIGKNSINNTNSSDSQQTNTNETISLDVDDEKIVGVLV